MAAQLLAWVTRETACSPAYLMLRRVAAIEVLFVRHPALNGGLSAVSSLLRVVAVISVLLIPEQPAPLGGLLDLWTVAGLSLAALESMVSVGEAQSV